MLAVRVLEPALDGYGESATANAVLRSVCFGVFANVAGDNYTIDKSFLLFAYRSLAFMFSSSR